MIQSSTIYTEVNFLRVNLHIIRIQYKVLISTLSQAISILELTLGNFINFRSFNSNLLVSLFI